MQAKGMRGRAWMAFMGLFVLAHAAAIRADAPTEDRPLMRLGRGAVNDAAWSPDDRHAAVAQQEFIRIIDLWDGSLVRELAGHTDLVRHVVYSPDGSMLYSASDDRTLRKWDATSGQEVGRVQLDHEPRGLAINTSGTLLASGENASQFLRVRTWSSGSLDLVTSHALGNSSYGISELQFSPSGNRLGISGYPARVLQLGDGIIKFSRNESGLRFGRNDDEILLPSGLYNTSGTLLWAYNDWSTYPNPLYVCYLPSRNAYAFAGYYSKNNTLEYQIRIYESSNGAAQQVMRSPRNAQLHRFKESVDGSFIQSAGFDGRLYAWETETGSLVRDQKVGDGSVLDTIWSNDGKTVFALQGHGDATAYDAQTGIIRYEWSLQQASISLFYYFDGYHFDLSELTNQLCMASSDGYIEIWDLEENGDSQRLFFPSEIIYDVAFSPSGRFLGIACYDGVYILDLFQFTLIARNEIGAYSIDFFDEYWYLGLGFENNQIVRETFWPNGQSGRLAVVNQINSGNLYRVTISDDRTRVLASGFRKYSLIDWTLPPIRVLHQQELAFEISAMAFVSGTTDFLGSIYDPYGQLETTRDVRLFEQDSINPSRYYDVPGVYTSGLSTSPDGKRVAIGTGRGIYIYPLKMQNAVGNWSVYE